MREIRPYGRAFLFGAWCLTAGLAFAQGSAVLTLERALDEALASPATSTNDRSALRLAVTRHYYDALLADLEYAAADEQMAMDYVTFDRARGKAGEPGRYDIAVKDLEVRYAKSFEWRLAARHRQRLARHALSAAMGSTTLADELEHPTRKVPQSLPDLAVLEKLMWERNRAWHSVQRSTEPERGRRRQELRSVLLQTLLDIERLARSVLPRLDREEELAQLRVEKARGDIERGLGSGLGLAMAGTSEVAFRRMQAQAELALAVVRLEGLLDMPIDRLPANRGEGEVR